MKIFLGGGLAFLLLACAAAQADTTSDLAQCEKTVKFKTGDISGDDVAACMKDVGYALDQGGQVDELTRCRNMFSPGIEARCYSKPGAREIGRVPAPLPADWRSRKVDELLAQEAVLNDRCHANGPSRFYTEDVCNQRERLMAVLLARGWCFEAAQTGSNKVWKACGVEE